MSTSHKIKVFFLLSVVTSILLLVACDDGGSKVEVSGPSQCIEMNTAKLGGLKKKALAKDSLPREEQLSAARELRDYYALCDLKGEYVKEWIYWAQVCAEIGDSADAHNLEGLREALGIRE